MKALGSRPRLLVAAILLCGATLLCAAQTPKPPDRGGLALLLSVKAAGPQAELNIEQTAAIIEQRCVRLNIYCKLQRKAGDESNRLLLRFSTPSDAGRVKRILLAEGFELRPVVSPPHPVPMLEYATRAEALAAARAGQDAFPIADDGSEAYLVAERPPILTGDDVRNCVVLAEATGSDEYEVDCQLRPRGAARLKAWTSANITRYVAVIFNGRVRSAPYIRAAIWYNVVISGGLDKQEADDISIVLESGNLPVPVELLEETTYKP